MRYWTFVASYPAVVAYQLNLHPNQSSNIRITTVILCLLQISLNRSRWVVRKLSFSRSGLSSFWYRMYSSFSSSLTLTRFLEPVYLASGVFPWFFTERQLTLRSEFFRFYPTPENQKLDVNGLSDLNFSSTAEGRLFRCQEFSNAKKTIISGEACHA